MINLDYLCIECGQKISEKIDDNVLQKALGVLREDGVYAMFLWLESKAKDARKELISLLNNKAVKNYLSKDSNNFQKDFKQFCEKLKETAKDIDKLFFMKKLLERTLTYALYHAKVEDKSNVAET